MPKKKESPNPNDPQRRLKESPKRSEPAPKPEEVETDLLVSSPWTRSPGRFRFRSLLQQCLDHAARRSESLFAILYVDLDRFARVNDSLGKETGDRLLIEAARRLRGSLRPQDIIIRLREDEYLVLLDEIPQIAVALEVVEAMMAAMREAFRVGRQEVFLSVSVGVALGPAGYQKADEMVRDAEAAMHRAKKLGPASYAVFDSQFTEEAKRLLQLETAFRGAMDRGELRLQYEPIMALDSDRVAGFEALVRWARPRKGLVHPGEFIPMAEQTGLIIPMTQWVIREACRQLRKWQDRFPDFATLWVSINLSPLYIQKCDFAAELAASIADNGINASNLALEITENLLLENADGIRQGLNALHVTGTKLWIDDFGSGYSSLAYLVNFPIHSLKIDRSFVSRLLLDEKSRAIAKAILSLGNSLGIHVIAEGVETAAQLEYLRTIGCPFAQGFYFAPSIDPETIDLLFTGRQNPGA